MARTQPHARVPSPKFGETNCENPFAYEFTFTRGHSALYFLHETHAKRQKSTFSCWLTRYTSYSTLHQGHSSLWVGGRAECEPRATPLSTRSILAVRRVNWLPLFPFSFAPHGRPPPFPTVCDILAFFLLFFVSPIVTQEKHVFQKLWCGRRIFPPYPPLGTYFEEKVCC